MSVQDDSYGPDTRPTESRNVDTNEYRIRKLEIRQAVQDEKAKNFEESIGELTSAVKTLTDTMNQAKGGWSTLATQGALIAFIIMIVDFAKDYFTKVG